MDNYGQIGPGKPGYDEDVDRVANALLATHGTSVCILFAANSTSHHIVLARLRHLEVLGGRVPGFADRGDALFVGIANGKATFLPFDRLANGYVEQYLGVPFGRHLDVDPLADFLNAIIERMGY